MKKITLVLAVLLFGSALGIFGGQAVSTSTNVPRKMPLGTENPIGWAMKMRIFEGIKEGASEPTKVVTSSYLQYRITATIQTEFDLAKEQKQIRKTFNLRDARLLTEADFSWPKDKYEKTFHMFRLDGKEYLVLITPIDVARKLQFRIEVFEQSGKDKTNLLNTEFSIPEKNIAVFGFEDKQGKPYFVSFRILGRMADQVTGQAAGVSGKPELGEGPLRAIGEIKAPRLIKRVEPVYPEDARRARVEGVVILEATTDIYGRVMTVKVLRSIPMLDQAAIDAVRQWVYEPMVINGKPRSMIFTTTVTFQLDGGKPKARTEVTHGEEPLRFTSGIDGPKRIKKVDPRYPEVARQARVEGTVILEATTDIYGRVTNLKVLRSIPLLDKAAIEAVKQWVYEPAIINGKPREVSFTVSVQFKLEGGGRLMPGDTFLSDVTPPAPAKGAKGEVVGGVEGGVEGGVVGGVVGGVKGGVEGGVAGGVISKEEEAKLMQLPPVKVGGSIKEPQKLKSVDPIYPEVAKNARIQGEVILEAETDIYGRVMNIKVLRSIPALDQAAIDAVRQWIYQPFIVDGRPRRAIFPVTVNFILNESLFFF
jgi:TonB family protein